MNFASDFEDFEVFSCKKMIGHEKNASDPVKFIKLL